MSVKATSILFSIYQFSMVVLIWNPHKATVVVSVVVSAQNHNNRPQPAQNGCIFFKYFRFLES